MVPDAHPEKRQETALTYIFHSGFMLEQTEQKSVLSTNENADAPEGRNEKVRCGGYSLIFDYWHDPAGAVSRSLRVKAWKQVYVFSSHFHEDHFNREIFRWRDLYPNTTFTYILSKDIMKHRRASKDEADVWLAKGATWKDENIAVRATGSNDSGVSWIVETGGMRIFHAGDLCNWYARFLTGDIPEQEIYSEEFGKFINPVADEKRFLGELKDIKKVTDTFDLAMFPVDGRIGNGYTLGGRQFIQRFKVGLFVPMHFALSGFESAQRMDTFCREKGVDFWPIRQEGECIILLKKHHCNHLHDVQYAPASR